MNKHDPYPDDETYRLAGDETYRLPDDEPVDETITGSGAVEDDVESSWWGGGCSWLVLLILIGILTLLAGGYYGLQWVVRNNMVPSIRAAYPDASLLPAQAVKQTRPDMQIHLYYIVRGMALAPQTRELPREAGDLERSNLVAKILSTPTDSELYESPLPNGAVIRGVYHLDNVLWVDLSAEFLNPPDPSPQREQLAIYGIVNSFMLNDRSVQGVRFMVEGKPITSAWGWLDLSSPLAPNLIE